MNSDIIAQHAIDRLKKAGIAGMTETERTVAAAWLIEAGVQNDGFSGYYASHRGDLAAVTPAALRKIGAVRLAEIAAEANAFFGPGGPPADRNARRDLVQQFPDSVRNSLLQLDDRYEACEEDVDELLEKFLAAQPPPESR